MNNKQIKLFTVIGLLSTLFIAQTINCAFNSSKIAKIAKTRSLLLSPFYKAQIANLNKAQVNADLDTNLADLDTNLNKAQIAYLNLKSQNAKVAYLTDKIKTMEANEQKREKEEYLRFIFNYTFMFGLSTCVMFNEEIVGLYYNYTNPK